MKMKNKSELAKGTKWRKSLAGKRTKKDARNGQSKPSQNSYEQAAANQPKRATTLNVKVNKYLCFIFAVPPTRSIVKI